MEEQRSDIHSLAIRYFEGRILPSEEKILFRFVHASEENKQIFRQWEAEWMHAAKLLPEVNVAWKQVQRRINLRESLEFQRPNLWRKWFAVAIVASILVLGGISSLYLLNQEREDAPELFALETAYGEKSKLRLPDGTIVWLNAGSTLRYADDFSRKREIYLSGEAYFEVTRQMDEAPFVVQTDRYDVRVKGTKFNVTSYPDEPLVKTTLLEGAIDILYEGKEVPISPGEQLSLNKELGDLTRQRVDASGYRSWTEGRMEYDRITLGELTGRLSRKYDVRIHLDKEMEAETAFRVSLRNEETVGDVLRALSHIIPIRYERKGQDIYIRKQ